jgi:serine/threonine protein phosphatase PrpC
VVSKYLIMMKDHPIQWADGLTHSQIQYVGERDRQEDAGEIRVLDSGGGVLLSVLSDGMGGHAGGEVASKLAVKTFFSTFESFKISSIQGRLSAAIQAANSEIAREIAKSPGLEGMGCTLVGLVISDESMFWISVGDSLLYLFRDGRLSRLNADHSMAPVLGKLVEAGQLSVAELKVHPQRNALRSAVTGEAMELIDLSQEPFRLDANDIVVCASDGILTLTESEISAILKKLRGSHANEIAKALVQAVKDRARSRQDNTTVQVLLPSMLPVVRAPHLSSMLLKVGILILFFVCVVIATLMLKDSGGLKSLDAPSDSKQSTNAITPITIDSATGSVSDKPNLNNKDRLNDGQDRSVDKKAQAPPKATIPSDQQGAPKLQQEKAQGSTRKAPPPDGRGERDVKAGSKERSFIDPEGGSTLVPGKGEIESGLKPPKTVDRQNKGAAIQAPPEGSSLGLKDSPRTGSLPVQKKSEDSASTVPEKSANGKTEP